MHPNHIPGSTHEAGTMPYVSVVMPHYRVRDEWALTAVRAALDQNYPRERLEVIVVDDASGDIRHLKSIPGIRLVELETNAGASVARNHGVSVSEGQYLFFADADDRIHPDAVRSCAYAAPGYALTYTDHRKVTGDLESVIHDRKKARFHELHEQYKGTLLDPLLHTSFVGMCQFVDASAFREIGGYDPTLKKGEDFDMLLRLSELAAGMNFAHVPRTLYEYRENKRSVSHDRSLSEQPLEVIRRALARRGYTTSEPVGPLRLKPYDNSFYDLRENGTIIEIPYLDRANERLTDAYEPLEKPPAHHPEWTAA